MIIEAAKGGHTNVVKLLLEWPNRLMLNSSVDLAQPDMPHVNMAQAALEEVRHPNCILLMSIADAEGSCRLTLPDLYFTIKCSPLHWIIGVKYCTMVILWRKSAFHPLLYWEEVCAWKRKEHMWRYAFCPCNMLPETVLVSFLAFCLGDKCIVLDVPHSLIKENPFSSIWPRYSHVCFKKLCLKRVPFLVLIFCCCWFNLQPLAWGCGLGMCVFTALSSRKFMVFVYNCCMTNFS